MLSIPTHITGEICQFKIQNLNENSQYETFHWNISIHISLLLNPLLIAFNSPAFRRNLMEIYWQGSSSWKWNRFATFCVQNSHLKCQPFCTWLHQLQGTKRFVCLFKQNWSGVRVLATKVFALRLNKLCNNVANFSISVYGPPNSTRRECTDSIWFYAAGCNRALIIFPNSKTKSKRKKTPPLIRTKTRKCSPRMPVHQRSQKRMQRAQIRGDFWACPFVESSAH